MMRAHLTLWPSSSNPSPYLSSLHFSPPLSSSSFLFSFTPNKRFHFLKTCSSLKQSKKPSLQKTPTTAPQSFKWLFSPKSDDDDAAAAADKGNKDAEDDTALKGTLLAGVLLLGIIGGFAFAGYVYKDPINAFLNQFSTFIDGNFVIIHGFLLFSVF